MTHGYECTSDGKVISFTGKEIGSINSRTGYVYITLFFGCRNTIKINSVHRFIFYYFHRQVPDEVDHFDGIKTNNKISNLRSLTHKQNTTNRNFAKGCYERNGKFSSAIGVDGKQIYLGTFDTYCECRRAYLTAKQKYHQYANTKAGLEQGEHEI
jgi:hypothetical protein